MALIAHGKVALTIIVASYIMRNLFVATITENCNQTREKGSICFLVFVAQWAVTFSKTGWRSALATVTNWLFKIFVFGADPTKTSRKLSTLAFYDFTNLGLILKVVFLPTKEALF